MTDKIIKLFNQLIGPMKRSVLLMIGRGVLLAVESSKPIQLASVKLLADETKDKTEFFQHFGFTSRPPANTDIIFLSIGGNRDHGAIIASENRALRLKGLDEGDCALYNKNGKFLKLKGDDLDALFEKVIINNSSHEYTALLKEFMETVRDGLVLTALGPQPWWPTTKTALQVVIDKFDTFKE